MLCFGHAAGIGMRARLCGSADITGWCYAIGHGTTNPCSRATRGASAQLSVAIQRANRVIASRSKQQHVAMHTGCLQGSLQPIQDSTKLSADRKPDHDPPLVQGPPAVVLCRSRGKGAGGRRRQIEPSEHERRSERGARTQLLNLVPVKVTHEQS